MVDKRSECRFSLIWNFEKHILEKIEITDGRNCLSISTGSLPFMYSDIETVNTRKILGAGYTHVSFYRNKPASFSTDLRYIDIINVKDEEKCDYCLVDESIGLRGDIFFNIQKIIEKILDIKPKKIYLLTGYDDNNFYNFYEKNGKTFLKFLFDTGVLEELKNMKNVLIVTRGLMTHNDIQIALEHEIGIILCISDQDDMIPFMLPLDEILEKKGNVFLSQCRYREDILSPFLMSYLTKTLFSFYRRKNSLSDFDYLSMVYMWWKELGLEPNHMVFYKFKLDILNNITLAKLVGLGEPDYILLDDVRIVFRDLSD